MVGKEVSEVERRLVVRQKYLDKISELAIKDIIEDDDFYALVRGFFTELLKLEYEFTYEEIILELNKIFMKPIVKSQIDSFLII